MEVSEVRAEENRSKLERKKRNSFRQGRRIEKEGFRTLSEFRWTVGHD